MPQGELIVGFVKRAARFRRILAFELWGVERVKCVAQGDEPFCPRLLIRREIGGDEGISPTLQNAPVTQNVAAVADFREYGVGDGLRLRRPRLRLTENVFR